MSVMIPSVPQPGERSAKADLLRSIIRGLYDGRYSPGQRLIESQLTAEYGLSRGPVREVLNCLAATGIVELTLQRGARVRILSVEEAIAILAVVERLVGLAAYLAAGRIHEAGVADRLQMAMDSLNEDHAPLDSAADAAARDAFYAALTLAAGNPELSRILPTVQIHLIRTQFRNAFHAVDRKRFDDYRLIFDAVSAGLPDVAEAAIRAHVRRSIDALSQEQQLHDNRGIPLGGVDAGRHGSERKPEKT